MFYVYILGPMLQSSCYSFFDGMQLASSDVRQSHIQNTTDKSHDVKPPLKDKSTELDGSSTDSGMNRHRIALSSKQTWEAFPFIWWLLCLSISWLQFQIKREDFTSFVFMPNRKVEFLHGAADEGIAFIN